jgi:signal transduction histidine kinase
MRKAGNLRRLIRRRPIRVRLTAVYGGLFLLAGIGLLAVTYGLVARSLPDSFPVKPATSASARPTDQSCRLPTPQQVIKCKLDNQNFRNGLKVGARTQRATALNHLMVYSLISLAAMALVSGVIGWIIAGRALRPVHAIAAAARRASEENLSERIRLEGPLDELKDLADTFDAMLGRLDAAFASQRRFVANASHELRTPLTVMRTAIDVTLAKPDRTPAQLEGMAAEVRQAVDKAEALIEALLTLARSDRGTGPREQLDLAVLAEDALDAAAPRIKAAALKVQHSLRPGLTSGDPVLVERMISNLIDNAARHNVAGGWIRVETGMRSGGAFVDVANGGAVIPDNLAPLLFEPFRRLERREGAHDGAGLGLSIVQSVTAAHGGVVSARSLSDGGLEVSALFPSQPGAHDRAEPGAPLILR